MLHALGSISQPEGRNLAALAKSLACTARAPMFRQSLGSLQKAAAGAASSKAATELLQPMTQNAVDSARHPASGTVNLRQRVRLMDIGEPFREVKVPGLRSRCA